jgi:hypothetical protein
MVGGFVDFEVVVGVEDGLRFLDVSDYLDEWLGEGGLKLGLGVVFLGDVLSDYWEHLWEGEVEVFLELF